ncbi:MAG: hypothetical protein RLY16_1226 [Bacteroidota bacterium]|jgi:homoserine dehydrogenase
MSLTTKLNIGLFGFGTVGKGLYDVLHQTPALQANIKKICIKQANKKRAIDAAYFTTQANDLLEDESINVIVELIDDAAAAFEIVKAALSKKKAVVSANKKMIATHFQELLQLQETYQTPFLYEGSCCASLPVIRNLEEYYDNDLLHSFRGIVNGSTNFILHKMFAENLEFEQALLEAQQAGFAESNPALDVEGFDAANKLSILLAHSFGTITHPEELIFTGIQNIQSQDAAIAAGRHQTIKLVAHAQRLKNGQLAAFVLPQLVATHDDLYSVSEENNAVIIESSFATKHFFKGKGAGAFPTAAAVLSDIAALRYQYKYEYKKIGQPFATQLTSQYYLKVLVRFEANELINESNFEAIEEWHQEAHSNWLVGIISAEKLLYENWWYQPGVSLIACENPVIDDLEYRKIRKRSLELAGVH